MKIAILTHPLGKNYGGILQNWALQQILIGMGHVPATIQYPKRTRKQTIKSYLRGIPAHIIKSLLKSQTLKNSPWPWSKSPYTKLLNFVKKRVELTPFMIDRLSESRLLKNDYNHLIIGSDQVWRGIWHHSTFGHRFAAFLSEASPITVVAYAASFGASDWEYTADQTAIAKGSIVKFKAVSVRESSGVDLCRDYLGVTAVNVLDPTLLLKKDDYLKLVNQKDLDRIPINSIGVYILDITDEKRQIVQEVCTRMGLKPHYIGVLDKDKNELPSIESWLAAFARCSYIITDSFHGTVFSIIFHRQFLAISNSFRGNDRFTSLLSIISLSDYLTSEEDGLKKCMDILRSPINWDVVDTVLNSQKNRSIEFLRNSFI